MPYLIVLQHHTKVWKVADLQARDAREVRGFELVDFPPTTPEFTDVADAFLLRPDPPELVETMDLLSSGVKQKNSSSGVVSGLPESRRNCVPCIGPCRFLPLLRSCADLAEECLRWPGHRCWKVGGRAWDARRLRGTCWRNNRENWSSISVMFSIPFSNSHNMNHTIFSPPTFFNIFWAKQDTPTSTKLSCSVLGHYFVVHSWRVVKLRVIKSSFIQYIIKLKAYKWKRVKICYKQKK